MIANPDNAWITRCHVCNWPYYQASMHSFLRPRPKYRTIPPCGHEQPVPVPLSQPETNEEKQ